MSETAAAALLDGHRLYQGFCDVCGRTEAHCTARVILAERDRLRARVESLEGRLMMIGVHTDQDHIRHLVGEMFTASTPTDAAGAEPR